MAQLVLPTGGTQHGLGGSGLKLTGSHGNFIGIDLLPAHQRVMNRKAMKGEVRLRQRQEKRLARTEACEWPFMGRVVGRVWPFVGLWRLNIYRSAILCNQT